MKIIDTHTHLYLPDFSHDIDQVLKRASDEGADQFYLPAIDSEHTPAMLRLESKYPASCFAMMGLHPCSVRENYQDELSMVSEWLKKRKFAAIGETGLDFFWDTNFVDEQYISFHQQCEWSVQYDLPLVIHTRNAMQQTIEVVKQYTAKGIRGIFHCFSGTHQDAFEIVSAGFLLGIGGVVTFKNAGVAEAIRDIDLAHIVVETDSPYLSPVPFRGKRNESGYITYVVQKLAEIKNVTTSEVAMITTNNAQRIFKK